MGKVAFYIRGLHTFDSFLNVANASTRRGLRNIYKQLILCPLIQIAGFPISLTVQIIEELQSQHYCWNNVR